MLDSGCLGCKDRKVGCHSTCEKYLKWKDKIDNDNKKRRKRINQYMNSYYHK